MEAQIETTIKHLQDHGFDTHYFPTAQEAADWLDQQIPDGAAVGVGGSVTVRSCGLLERLAARQVKILNHWQGITEEEKDGLFRESHRAEAYLCSANAITADGFILNVDGTGNRLAAHCYGPKRLYLMAGVNKLVPDVPAALERVKRIAPLNCRRLGLKTPCVETGVCCDCSAPARSCNAYLLLKRPTRAVPVSVVLIGEEMGL